MQPKGSPLHRGQFPSLLCTTPATHTPTTSAPTPPAPPCCLLQTLLQPRLFCLLFNVCPTPLTTHTPTTSAATPVPATWCLPQMHVPPRLSPWVKQHKVQGVIRSIQVAQPLQATITELHLNVPLASSITFSITCTRTQACSNGYAKVQTGYPSIGYPAIVLLGSQSIRLLGYPAIRLLGYQARVQTAGLSGNHQAVPQTCAHGMHPPGMKPATSAAVGAL